MSTLNSLKRLSVFAFSAACYGLFFGVFLYSIGFVGNYGVANSLDAPARGSFVASVLGNGLLLTLFALQHSGMARPTFKKWWTQFVPEPMERSVYVLASCLGMILIFHFWQPMGTVIWQVENTIGWSMLTALFAIGWMTVFYSTCLLNHFELFGLRQSWLYFRGKEYTPLAFRTPSLYRYVRHPLYVGWLIVCWATPTMSVSHLLFAIAITGYILVAIQLEERNLIDFLPGYDNYRQRVPMLLPKAPLSWIGRSKSDAAR